MRIQALCRQLGYEFKEPALLRQALTHRSYGTPNNERLEFLGDSALNCVIATRLYHLHSRLPEGDLSRMRAHLVKEQTLSEIAAALQLGDHVRLGEGELKSGGFRRPSILADTLEAILGAIYLDGGFSEAERVISSLYDPLLKTLDPRALGKDPKTLLQEYLQGARFRFPNTGWWRSGVRPMNSISRWSASSPISTSGPQAKGKAAGPPSSMLRRTLTS